MPVTTMPAIFIDRDGVIIENRDDYVKSWQEVAIYPDALAALATVRDQPYKIVLVTNQSAISRGLISAEAAEEINRRLKIIVEANGGRLDGIYMCPHRDEDGCDCRKPKPGLLFRASRELGIDLSQSILIGDALSDIQAGQAAGVKTCVLVLTGRGKQQARLPQSSWIGSYHLYADLSDVFKNIFKRNHGE